MPYVIVEGLLSASSHSQGELNQQHQRGNVSGGSTPDRRPTFQVSVSGLKANELLDLKNFSPGVGRGDNYTITFPQHPCVILNALEVLGFRVVSSAPRSGGTFGNQESIVWTMRKEFEK